jgi:hypothetical protein
MPRWDLTIALRGCAKRHAHGLKVAHAAMSRCRRATVMTFISDHADRVTRARGKSNSSWCWVQVARD